MAIKWNSEKSFKNLTPHEISIYAAWIIAALFMGVAILLRYGPFIVDAISILAVSLVFFFLAYLIFHYILQFYIYRKIKLIYKIIHDSKRSYKEGPVDLDISQDILSNVERDVKEWADAQEEEIEDLKRLENYRKRYIGDISHELKTPIFNSQGYLHTLQDGGIDDPEVRDRYLRRAITNLDRLTTIVEDLDLITRLESEAAELEIAPFDIYVLAQDVIEDQEMLANDHRIELSFKEGADRHYTVLGDQEAIRQVLTNLIVNSLKYGDRNSVSGRTRIGFYDMDEYILVEIADNGIGIEDKHLKHVFDRFYRVDRSRSRSLGGSGLGLSIVKHIIESHGQTINVRSSPGIGSTFGFTLAKYEAA